MSGKAKISVLADNNVLFGTYLLGQHGVSYFIEFNNGDTSTSLLMDVGKVGSAVVSNAKKLNIDLTKTNFIFLSHCHYDHTGGLLDVLKVIGKKNIPIIAHPELFKPNYYYVKGSTLKYIGMHATLTEIEALGGKLLLAKNPFEIVKGIWSSGEIPRITDFEDPGIDIFTIRDGKLVKDEMMDDMSLIIDLDDGIVVLTGCGHAGVINIIKHAIKITKKERVKAVIGGFHLMSASDRRISKTIEAMKELNVEKVYTGHCTGFKAQAAFFNELKERFQPLTVGLEIEF